MVSLLTYPPDLVIVTVTLISFQLFDLLVRHKLSARFPTYRSLPLTQRYEWDRRLLNLTFQFLQCIINLHLLLRPSPVTKDPIYGYSSLAHAAFLVILSFYLYDTAAAYIMHPSPPSQTPLWIIHHYVAIFLLLYNVSFRQCSAYPAATFLISAAGHIPNDMRWFMTALQIRHQQCWHTVHIACCVICIVTCVLPPPYLLVKCAHFLHVSVWHLITSRMRFYCNFFFALIYIPHVLLCFYQVHRAYRTWGLPPEPFRIKKVD